MTEKKGITLRDLQKVLDMFVEVSCKINTNKACEIKDEIQLKSKVIRLSDHKPLDESSKVITIITQKELEDILK